MFSLEAFRRGVERDPLFAAEGLDLASMERAIGTLEKSARALEKGISLTWPISRFVIPVFPIAKFCLPVPFLKALVVSERRRREFLAAPSEEKARMLIRSWNKAQRALMWSARRYSFIHFFLFWLPNNTPKSILMSDMAGNTFTKKDVQRACALIRENARVLKRAIRDFPNHRAPAPSTPLPQSVDVTLTEANQLLLKLEEKVLFRAAEVLQKFSFMHTVSVFNGAPGEHPFFLYFLKDTTSGERRVHVCLGDRFQFLALQTGDEKDYGRIGRVIFEPLIERGLKYWHQPTTLFYTMRDQRYWADLASAADLTMRPELNERFVREQKSSAFDLILRTYARYLHFIKEMIILFHHEPPLRSYSLYKSMIFYSAPSILFMPFNRSIWRLPEEPNFIGSGRVAPEKNVYRYADEVVPATTDLELELIMQGGNIRRDVWKEKGYI